MNRIDLRFAQLKRENRKALIAYITAGYPSLTQTEEALKILQGEGADVVELGMPFSDPIADGPTIQRASAEALRRGMTLRRLLDRVNAWRSHVHLPLVLMTYCNPVEAMTPESFFTRAARAGFDGVLFPDLIPEEGQAYQRAAKRVGLNLIYLAAPTTPLTRLAKIARATQGFLYAVSLTGVTGMRRALAPGLQRFLIRAKRVCPKPLAVGFGLSSPEQIRRVKPYVDGVIVGSAFVEAMRANGTTRLRQLQARVQQLRRALDTHH